MRVVAMFRVSSERQAEQGASLAAQQHRYRLSLPGLPPQVTCRVLTLEAEVPAAWCRTPLAWVNGKPLPAELSRPRHLRLTVEVTDGMELLFQAPQ